MNVGLFILRSNLIEKSLWKHICTGRPCGKIKSKVQSHFLLGKFDLKYLQMSANHLQSWIQIGSMLESMKALELLNLNIEMFYLQSLLQLTLFSTEVSLNAAASCCCLSPQLFCSRNSVRWAFLDNSLLREEWP